MAKRKRKEDEAEDKGFKIPKFNKEEFLKRERRNIKTTFWSVIFGFFMALLCAMFWILMGPETPLRWYLVLLVMIGDAVFLRYVFSWRKLDISDFTKKNWFTTYGTYVFSWLILFIVLINPPIYDGEAPRVEMVVLPEMQEFGGSIELVAKITDNTVVEKSGITLTIDGTAIDQNDFTFEDNIFKYTYENDDIENETDLEYKLIVKDKSGWETESSGTFSYSDAIIFVPEPPYADNVSRRPEVGSATTIKIKVNADVDRVYYTLNDGEQINASLEGDYYVTEPKYEGWPKGTNVTMKVYAEKIHIFDIVVDKTPSTMSEEEKEKFLEDKNNNTHIGTIVDTQEYYFKVLAESGVGTEEPIIIPKKKTPIVQVPGFEALIFILALLSVILIFKYKKKDKR